MPTFLPIPAKRFSLCNGGAGKALWGKFALGVVVLCGAPGSQTLTFSALDLTIPESRDTLHSAIKLLPANGRNAKCNYLHPRVGFPPPLTIAKQKLKLHIFKH